MFWSKQNAPQIPHNTRSILHHKRCTSHTTICSRLGVSYHNGFAAATRFLDSLITLNKMKQWFDWTLTKDSKAPALMPINDSLALVPLDDLADCSDLLSNEQIIECLIQHYYSTDFFFFSAELLQNGRIVKNN